MSSNKSQEEKDFQISERKKIGSGLTNAPVWLMQKKGERIWNARQKRTWKNIEIGDRFKKHVTKQKPKHVIKSGDHKTKSIKRNN